MYSSFRFTLVGARVAFTARKNIFAQIFPRQKEGSHFRSIFATPWLRLLISACIRLPFSPWPVAGLRSRVYDCTIVQKNFSCFDIRDYLHIFETSRLRVYYMSFTFHQYGKYNDHFTDICLPCSGRCKVQAHFLVPFLPHVLPRQVWC